MAGHRPVSGRTDVLMPNMTKGKWSIQAAEVVLAQIFSLMTLWMRSTIPLHWGWYAVVRSDELPRRVLSSVHKEDMNCRP